MRLGGGGVPSVAQRSIASRLARKNIEVDTLLEYCWPIPRDGGVCCGLAKCCELDQHCTRTVSGCFKSLPCVSVCASEPRRTQYSVAVCVWITSGSVSGRFRIASCLPVRWSVLQA